MRRTFFEAMIHQVTAMHADPRSEVAGPARRLTA